MATIVTVVISAPVLRAPSERMFGMEIIGRHHDPFTVMVQFGRPIGVGVYSQPVTDITGALLARRSGAVAAYNWLVLLSFPLSAAAAYLLARHLALSPAGSTVAAMAYAFSPFHLAHAAYHPHVAQTQWLPLYLLALWRCLDAASPAAVGFLAVASLAVTFSNFYGGLIAAVITPVAVAAYWLVTRRADPGSMRRLGITVGSLLLIAASGMAYAGYAAQPVVVNRAAYAFSRDDLFRYSAKWWSYLVPPVEHPLLGASVERFWSSVGIRLGLLEQQVSLGWGIVALGLVAVVGWLARGDRLWHPASRARVPVLVVIAVAALLCSLSPERTIAGFTLVRPSAFFYHVVPMFRAYARFGVVVQLMAALLAGIGVDYLRRTGTRRAQIACLALVGFAAAEYTVWPPALWRDVLPTSAHRWVAQQPGRVRALDCVPLNQESQSVLWLTGYRVALLDRSISDCMEPNLSQKLAANGYTHLLVRRDTATGQWFTEHPALDGLRVAANFNDGLVLAVTARAPAIYTAAMTGFSPRESNADWTWRWMGQDAAWTIVNTRAQPIVATLGIELSAFHRARQVEVRLDGRPVQSFVVEPPRRLYQIDPLVVPHGDHE
ncbi:MAG TPA: hypothetical protein VK886_08505, partial [Vicinamibacterales bacterium]|nr:hypothetical protein [Vicinamibacterales bacterium]